MNFCGSCGARLPKPRLRPSQIGERRREDAKVRWNYLLDNFSTKTVATAASLMSRLMMFLVEDGLTDPTPYDVQPLDVVRFFQACDDGGRTTVHESECLFWGQAKYSACGCPRRMVYDSLRVNRFKLQGAFRDLGLGDEWNPRAVSGNPCNAPLVDRFLDMIQAEQCDSGVAVRQAALMDVSFFDAMMSKVLLRWLRAVNRARQTEWADTEVAIEAVSLARDALYYAILWDSGLRASDALRLNSAQFQFFGATEDHAFGGLYLLVNKTKSTSSLDRVHRITIPFPDPASTSVPNLHELWQALDMCLNELGVLERSGRMFKTFDANEDGLVAATDRCTWNEMDKRYSSILHELGVKDNSKVFLSLHSYHGSRAAREKKAGVPKHDTCASMLWSEEMYDYYTNGREPLTMDGILALVKAQAPPAVAPVTARAPKKA